ncbi:metallophosphoesterase [Apibacter sp. HY039]|uniref:metallophosphoesterase family protein n=1 Tax=Apibacter sp. HY039 TaxID=2501476 RepID=UPI0013E2C766|nr:metallophosphoesterase [Apibacter sp. HY039]
MNKKIMSILLVLCVFFAEAQSGKPKLRFAFMTDIHLNYKNKGNCFEGFQKALKKVEKSNVEFILLGGDLVDVDKLNKNYNRADSLYTAFKAELNKSSLSIYPAIGNHDRFFDEEKGYTKGDELFNKHFKQSYYTFEKKNVRFFVLNSVQRGDKEGYYYNKEQINWLNDNLKTISPETPIIVVTHVPIYSLYYPVVEGRYVFLDVVNNYKELLEAFKGYNLKLVLQGHQHLYEEIYSQDVQYITAGAISAAWWYGPFYGTKEGFLTVDVDSANKIKWEYIDYGWKHTIEP